MGNHASTGQSDSHNYTISNEYAIVWTKCIIAQIVYLAQEWIEMNYIM